MYYQQNIHKYTIANILAYAYKPSPPPYPLQIGYATPTGTCAQWVTYDYPLYGAWMRINRMSSSPPGGPSTFSVQFRLSQLEDWVSLAGTCSESALPNGALPPARTLAAAVAINRNTGRFPGSTTVDNFRISELSCATPGSTRMIAAPPLSNTAVISGLTPGASYWFESEAGTNAELGPSSPLFGPVVMPTAVPTPPAPMTLNLARGAVASMTGSQGAAHPASAGVNGNYDQVNNWFQTGAAPCTDLGCWWQLQLPSPSDVVMISLWNRADTPTAAAAAAGTLVYVSTSPVFLGSGSTLCSPLPASLFVPPYQGNVTCSAASGLYVTLMAPAGSSLSMSQVEVYAANSCPALTTTFALQSGGAQCGAGAPYGATCIQTCNVGYTAVSGASVATCTGANWNVPPLVCLPQCNTVMPPPNVAACQQTLVADNFTPPPGLPNGTLAKWFALDPAKAIGISWFVADGQLQASASWGCEDEQLLVAGSDAVRDYTGSWSASVYVFTDDRAGLVRAIDASNFLRFYIDVISGVHELEVVIGGQEALLADASLPLQVSARKYYI